MVLAVFGLIAVGVSEDRSLDSNTDTASQTSGSPSPTTVPTPAPEKMTLSNAVYKDDGFGGYEVEGEATNNDTIEHSATLIATFYDSSGAILGTADGAVDQLAPGQTKTYQLIGSDSITDYASMKVEVSTLL